MKTIPRSWIFACAIVGLGAGCGDDGGPADASGFQPGGSWLLSVNSEATVRASYANPDVTRQGSAVAADIYFTPVNEIPDSTIIDYDSGAHSITLSLSGMDRIIPLDASDSGTVTVEGPTTERIDGSLCDFTRSVAVEIAFASPDSMVETIVQTFAYANAADGVCTHPAGLCTCGQIMAFGLSSEPPNPFYDSIRGVQSAEGPVIDQTRLEDLTAIVVEYHIDGTRAQARAR